MNNNIWFKLLRFWCSLSSSSRYCLSVSGLFSCFRLDTVGMEVQNTVIKRISTPKTTKNKFSRFFRQLKIPRQYFSLKYPPIFRVFFVFFVLPKTPLFFAKNFAKNRPVPKRALIIFLFSFDCLQNYPGVLIVSGWWIAIWGLCSWKLEEIEKLRNNDSYVFLFCYSFAL